jgi:hypothetical protein
VLRVSAVGVVLAGVAAIPFAAVVASGLSAGELLQAGFAGLAAAVDSVGWVLVPQIVLAIAILSVAIQQFTGRLAGLRVGPAPHWLDPAVESALLLGLLGTIHGMVLGFAGLSPDELQPGPLVHSLGTALRSSFVGFLIALVGVWAKARPAEPEPESLAPASSMLEPENVRPLRREAEPA